MIKTMSSMLKMQDFKKHQTSDRTNSTWQYKHINTQVHIDLVGPLLHSDNFKYIITVVDRFPRQPEAYPSKDIETKTIVQCLVKEYVSRFGVTDDEITTDQGSQFESSLFKKICCLLDTIRIKTTAYHGRTVE